MRPNWIAQWNDDDLKEWLIDSYPSFIEQPELFIKKYSETLSSVRYKNKNMGDWMKLYHDNNKSLPAIGL